jgi:hypothetical protein
MKMVESVIMVVELSIGKYLSKSKYQSASALSL